MMSLPPPASKGYIARRFERCLRTLILSTRCLGFLLPDAGSQARRRVLQGAFEPGMRGAAVDPPTRRSNSMNAAVLSRQSTRNGAERRAKRLRAFCIQYRCRNLLHSIEHWVTSAHTMLDVNNWNLAQLAAHGRIRNRTFDFTIRDDEGQMWWSGVPTSFVRIERIIPIQRKQVRLSGSRQSTREDSRVRNPCRSNWEWNGRTSKRCHTRNTSRIFSRPSSTTSTQPSRAGLLRRSQSDQRPRASLRWRTIGIRPQTASYSRLMFVIWREAEN